MTERAETFELTELHLRLAREMIVRWEDCEFGAPAIDCKRPYGNSQPLEDMREFLEVPEAWSDDALNIVHRQMETALTIILAAAGDACPAGLYERTGSYGQFWSRRTSSSSGLQDGTE